MDPLSIISAAGSVLQLVSQGRDMVEMAKEIHCSPVGATKTNQAATSSAGRTQAFTQAVRVDKPTSLLTEDERLLYEAATECESICSELEKVISKLSRGTRKRSAIVSAYFAVRSWFARDQVRELDARVARCEGHVSAHLLRIMQ